MNTSIVILCIVIAVAIIYIIGPFRVFYKEYKKAKANKISFKETIDLTGLPIVTFKHNGKRINFILDTGASASVINESVLTHVDHIPTGRVESYFGIDGYALMGEYVTIHLNYKDATYEEDFKAVNLDTCFSKMKSEYGVNLHGIIGSSFLQKYKYIIDFDELVAYSTNKG